MFTNFCGEAKLTLVWLKRNQRVNLDLDLFIQNECLSKINQVLVQQKVEGIFGSVGAYNLNML